MDSGKKTGPGMRCNRKRQGGKDTVLFAQAAGHGSGSDGATADAEMVSVVLCVDDTDDVSGETSTGYVAETIASRVGELGGRVILGITRHQLLLAEGVPYTSHNSAMCFEARLPESKLDELRRIALDALDRHCAATADPGLCIAVLPDGADHDGAFHGQAASLAAFGDKAQREVCTKEEAYELAAAIPWVRLSEHGGTGDGIIGALAGVGLRLSGDDGRFRGMWDLAQLTQRESVSAVSEFRASLQPLVCGDVQVVDESGNEVSPDEDIALIPNAKPYLQHGALTFSTRRGDAGWEPLGGKELAPVLEMHAGGRRDACERFVMDNDYEECFGHAPRTCGSCLFRRWTPQGFCCMEDVAQAVAI